MYKHYHFVLQNDDSDDEDISCTPALAPSSVAQRFVQVTKANDDLSSTVNTRNLLQHKVLIYTF